MDVWGWLGTSVVAAVFVLALWALRRQSQMYPRNRERIGPPEERKRGLRWIGFIYGGGHG